MAGKGSNSKRKALRFRLTNKKVAYMTAGGEMAEAYLDNISTTGCLLSKCSSAVNKDEEVMIVIELADQNRPLELRGVVNRVDKDQFSAEFTHLEDKFMPQMATMLATEIRNSQVE